MSLLMDALKRAEKARQAQADKQSDGRGMSSSKLDLDPIDDDPPQEATPPEPPSAKDVNPPPEGDPPESPPASGETPQTPSPQPMASPAEDQATTHFSLSDDFPATEKVPPPAQSEGEQLGPFSLIRDNELSLEDTGEMLPVVRDAEKSLNQYFDEPDSAATTSGAPEETAGDDVSTVLGGRSSGEGDSHARRAAQGVFKAKAPAVARYRRNRTLMIALPLLLLGVVGIGVLMFWDQLERTFFGVPQLMPPRPPQTADLAAPPETAAATEASKLAAAAQAATADQATAAAAQTPAVSETSAIPAAGSAKERSATGGVSSEAMVAPSSRGAVPAAGGGTQAGAGSSLAVPPAPRPALTRPPLASVGRPYAVAFVEGVRISRRSNPDKVHAGINEAYLAFQRGDDAAARALYAEVHRQHPNNRNALLGLGAIAMRSGNYSEAMRRYARLLSINPRDPIARAALINLNQGVPPGEGETHVKRLLLEDPEQPFLYFTLGNLYARQGRWVEAQQAYFDAHRRDSDNADFAFNLAVSLDRLGQPAAALTYYHRALELAARGVASFEPRVARMRIERLNGGGQG